MGGFRELTLNAHKLLTDTRLAGNSTDTKPTVDEEGGELPVGREWFAEDTGQSWYWDGSEWVRANYTQKIDQQTELLFEIRDLLTQLISEG
jgi:hypothetical protein